MMRRTFKLAWLIVAALPLACMTPAEELEAGESVDSEAESVTPSPLFLGDPANNAVFAVDIAHWQGPMSQYEMDCYWSSGVRHLVAGTQVRELTQQQLSMALSRGMTVDAYVYLYWDRDMGAQVREAFSRAGGFPIGRMWLDVEEAPAGRGANTLIALVQQAVDVCRAQGGAECGIYTGPGFWKSYMANTTRFADLPLWYAQYNYKTSLSNWPAEKFGGWSAPAAKQWAEEVMCSVGTDKNTMQVVTTPSVVVDRTLPPNTGTVPAAPTGVYPADGFVTRLDYVKLMTATVPRATNYQFAYETWDGTAFKVYYTWSATLPFRKITPYWNNRIYRFRARAKNAYGWGGWSAWSTFDFGTWTGARPGDAPPPPPPVEPPPPSTGAPTNLSPDGAAITTSSVTMSCGTIQAATRYEFAIEYLSGASYLTYTTYLASTNSKTFWPSIHGTTYRWRVRAQVNGTMGPWSSYASFQFR